MRARRFNAMHLHAAVVCMDHDIGLQNTFWTGPGIGNWGRPADCATFMTSQADPEAFCQGKIGSSQTFSERYGKWTGFNEHQNVASEPGGKSLNFSAFPDDAVLWDYWCGASCAEYGVYAAHCDPAFDCGGSSAPRSPPAPPALPASPSSPPTPPASPPPPPISPPSPPPPKPPSTPKASSDELAVEAIIGIVVGVIVIIGAVGVGVFMCALPLPMGHNCELSWA